MTEPIKDNLRFLPIEFNYKLKETDLTTAFKINKQTWNERVAVHTQSDFYNLEAFRKGRSSLHCFELEALGNISGKTLLHLQCHFGQDTLSLSRLGALCTGIDFSEKAIVFAQDLNKELLLDATFICCNVLDTSNHVTQTFDIVFTSYGTIGWLPDLAPWAKMIAQRLKTGGTFYIVDFHPIAWMFDYTVTPAVMRYGYDQKQAIYEQYMGSYAAPKSNLDSKEYGWNHSLSSVINALIGAGLSIESIEEHPQSPYNVFPSLERTDSGMYQMPNSLYPLLFSIKATKKH